MAYPKDFLSRAYTGLAPYLLPVVLAFSLYLYFSKPAPEIITETITNTEYVTVEAPPVIETETVYIDRVTTITEYLPQDTVYLPGEEVTVYVVRDSADFDLSGVLDSSETAVQLNVSVKATYRFPPVNKMTLGARLNTVSMYKPQQTFWEQLHFGAGLHLRQKAVGLNGSIYFNKYSVLLGLDTGGLFVGGQYLIK